MFIDKDAQDKDPIVGKKPIRIIFFSMFLILAICLAGAFFIIEVFNKSVSTEKNDNGNPNIIETGKLPGIDDNNNGDDPFATSTMNGMTAEYLTFGHFYEKKELGFKPNKETYELPINVKVDVANYYDVSRRINLDPYIEDFNKDGFAIIKEPLFNADNFYSGYKELLNNDIPILLTTDFLIYYNQNHLNQVFKEIEKNIFYDNLWEINKELFDIALTKYKKRLNEVGLMNDPVLEGVRLEMAYYAVALSLLRPREEQINDKQNLVDETKFSVQDADTFSFVMPDYLKNDVSKELDLIYEAKGENKSPIFLYFKDYKEFKVPKNYKGSAKLNNFYLTLKWLNSVFPLYYRSEECSQCLLDHDDWVVNMAAASFIAQDVYDNEDIKNKWANIYKFVSFFSGLRGDLTYLQYHEALLDTFGEDYSIEDVFSSDNENREDDISRLRNNLMEFYFSKLEGSFDRESMKHKLGMRMLQENYWPNDYIFSSLTGEDINIPLEKVKNDRLITSCKSTKYYQNSFRCVGFGMDVVNLIHPDISQIDTREYLLNTQYNNYAESLMKLQFLVDDFDVNTWNNNIYWTTLDLAHSLFSYDRSGYPVAINSNSWKNKKDINTILGAWVNLHLQQDMFVNYFEEEAISGFGTKISENLYSFIEPNVSFIDELIAKNEMLLKMFFALQLSKKTNVVSVQLKDLNDTLKRIREIAVKELQNEELSTSDLDFIVDFSRLYFVKEKGDKEFDIRSEWKRITESIDGIKFVALIYDKNGKKIIVIGPIFNYREK